MPSSRLPGSIGRLPRQDGFSCPAPSSVRLLVSGICLHGVSSGLPRRPRTPSSRRACFRPCGGSVWTTAGALVVKVRPPSPHLAGCFAVQRHLWQAGFPCPEPLGRTATPRRACRYCRGAALYVRDTKRRRRVRAGVSHRSAAAGLAGTASGFGAQSGAVPGLRRLGSRPGWAVADADGRQPWRRRLPPNRSGWTGWPRRSVSDRSPIAARR